MRKTYITFLILILILGLVPLNFSSAAGLAARLKGRILLQVESNGEAWYINPDNEKRYYLGRPADAFQIMRDLGLGISNRDFDSFNGFAANRLSGKILLKVEDSGKAYYVNPVDLKMHYLGRPNDAFNIMRNLGLGISEKNFDMLSNDYNIYTNQQLGIEFKYPNYWILNNASSDEFNNYGHVAFFETADTNKLIEQKKIHPAYSKNLVISYWDNINNEHAKGGTWIGDREYTGLDDFLSNNGGSKQKISEIIINEKKGYEVSIGGYGSCYGIMVEKNGIYELSFDRFVDKTKLSEGERMVIDSFRLIE